MSNGSNGMPNMVSLLTTTYGPFAFGVISFIVIWFTAVKPELDSRTLDWQTHTQTLGSLSELSQTQHQIARSMEYTAKTMESTAKVLQETVEQLRSDYDK